MPAFRWVQTPGFGTVPAAPWPGPAVHRPRANLVDETISAVNVAFEKGVWGAFRTEYYPTYDYLAVFNDLKKKDLEHAGAATPAESP